MVSFSVVLRYAKILKFIVSHLVSQLSQKKCSSAHFKIAIVKIIVFLNSIILHFTLIFVYICFH